MSNGAAGSKARSPFQRLITGLEYLGKLTILGTAVSFLINHDAELRAQRDEAWHKIVANAWSEQPANRAAALEILVGQGVNLDGVALGPVNFLPGINLSGCLTVWGHAVPFTCRGSRLEGVQLEWARLPGASFRRANLRSAHLKGAWLVPGDVGNDSDLQSTDFSYARLEAACLDQAHVERAKFVSAAMTGATFYGAWISGADFSGSNVDATQIDTACFDPIDPPKLPTTLSAYDRTRPNPASCDSTRTPFWLKDLLRKDRVEAPIG